MTRELWVPDVNALGGFGRWGFEKFRDWAVIEQDFATFIDRLMGQRK
jgi:type III restriction enzyme